jgi:uncharacterized OB-fold protein
MPERIQGVYPAPLNDPYADELTAPFWAAALEDRLVMPKCTACGTFVFPPQPRCFNCQSTTFDNVELGGTGTIYSFTVVRHPLAPHLAEIVPYVSGVVELDGTQGAGARMIANLVDVDPATVAIGDHVKVVFDKVSDTLAVPRFAPV